MERTAEPTEPREMTVVYCNCLSRYKVKDKKYLTSVVETMRFTSILVKFSFRLGLDYILYNDISTEC